METIMQEKKTLWNVLWDYFLSSHDFTMANRSTVPSRATKGSLSYHVPFLSKLWARPQRHSHVCSCGHLPGNSGNFYNVPFDVNGDTQTWQRKIRWLLFGRHRCLLAVAWTLLLSNICQRRSLVSRLFDGWIYMECMKHQQTLILVLGK